MKTIALSVVLFFAGAAGYAQDALFASYETEIARCEKNILDPQVARDCGANAQLLSVLQSSDVARAARLVEKANAVADLSNLIDLYPSTETFKELGAALESRLDSQAYVRLGLGPEPERILGWILNYKDKERVLPAAKAIRAWGFFPEPEFVVQLLAQSHGRPLANFLTQADINWAKATWSGKTLEQRNVILAQMADIELKYMMTMFKTASQDKINLLLGEPAFEYLDQKGRAKLNNYINQLKVMIEIEDRQAKENPLLARYMINISSKPIEEQLSLLNRYFDGTPGLRNSETALKIRASVNPFYLGVQESITPEINRKIGSALEKNLSGELNSTAVGKEISSYYKATKRGKPSIRIENCPGCYAKFEPETGQIVIDSDLVKQYMRMNRYKPEDLVKMKPAMDGLVKFVAPLFVHEATHQMQHGWSQKRGLFDPYVQDDETEANAKQSLYVLDKMSKDKTFELIMSKNQAYIPYVERLLESADAMSESPDRFYSDIKNVQYPGLPSTESAFARTLGVVNAEIERRAKLKEDANNIISSAGATDEAVKLNSQKLEQLKETDASGIAYSEAVKLDLEKLERLSVDIKTDALAAIRDTILNRSGEYRQYAADSRESVMRMLAQILSAPQYSGDKVPQP